MGGIYKAIKWRLDLDIRRRVLNHSQPVPAVFADRAIRNKSYAKLLLQHQVQLNNLGMNVFWNQIIKMDDLILSC